MLCPNCANSIPDGSLSCQHCGYPMNTAVQQHHLRPGDYLMNRYFVGRAIGEGGFGITYIGRDINLDVRVAIKEFFPSGYSTRNNQYSSTVSISSNANFNYETNILRFLKEARLLAKFSDEPGVVGVKDFFRANGTAYIVMEYLDGITLKAQLRKNGPFKVDDLIAKMSPVIQSLEKIHEAGLIHRDISPDNIMMLRNGKVKLLDFGAARDYTDENKSLSIMLKHGYAPEEQYRTKGVQGPWTDVYALCATMYKCLSGVTPEQSMQRAFDETDSLKSLRELNVDITPELDAAIIKGLSIRRQDRYQNMAELYDALHGKSHPVSETKKDVDKNSASMPSHGQYQQGGQQMQQVSGQQMQPQINRQMQQAMGQQMQPQANRQIQQVSGQQIQPQVNCQMQQSMGQQMQPQVNRQMQQVAGQQMQSQVNRQMQQMSGQQMQPQVNRPIQQAVGRQLQPQMNPQMQRMAYTPANNNPFATSGVCPKCGMQVETDDLFCGYCGQKLQR